MYTTSVDAASRSNPRMFAVDFERPRGRLAFTLIVPARVARPAMEEVLRIFPEFHRAFRRAQVHEAAFVDINWEIGRASVARRSRRPHARSEAANHRRVGAGLEER